MLFVSLIAVGWSADFYADPNAGSGGDGSAGNPWGSLESVVAAGLFETAEWDVRPYLEGVSILVPKTNGPIGPGDTLWLRSGYHGDLLLESAYNAGPITIAAQSGHNPMLSNVHIRGGSNWVLRGLSVSPSHGSVYSAAPIVDFESHGFHGPVQGLELDGCQVFSVPDIAGWTAADWNDLAADGVHADGTDITLRNNHFLNVDFGISVHAERSLVEHNRVENFSGDGMRGLGDFTTYQYNTVMNAYDVNENHDDGFQSWSVGPDGVGTGEVTGIVLRGNTILNYTDENQPLRGPLQGIGCFDGTFVDWVIENNVIVTDHWHGITLLGTRNIQIVNNTVVDLNTTEPGPPWIQIGPHKNGTPSVGGLVRNNLATGFSSEPSVAEDHNILVTDLGTHFVAHPDDMHLVATSPAIDAGTFAAAPADDLEGVSRPQGAMPDVGAYEFTATPPPPPPPPSEDTGSPPPPPPPPEDTGSQGGGSGSSCNHSRSPWILVLLLPLLTRRSGWVVLG